MILIYKSFERGRQLRLLSDFPGKINLLTKSFYLDIFWNKFVHGTLYNQGLHETITEISRNFDKNRNCFVTEKFMKFREMTGHGGNTGKTLAQVWSKWDGEGYAIRVLLYAND